MNDNQELLDRNVFVKNKSIDQDAKNTGPIKHFNESSIFYKGLFGMIFCIIPAAIIGLILVKNSLDQSKEARSMINKNPENYLDSTIKRINTGRIMAYIGLALFILDIVVLMIYMSVNS